MRRLSSSWHPTGTDFSSGNYALSLVNYQTDSAVIVFVVTQAKFGKCELGKPVLHSIDFQFAWNTRVVKIRQDIVSTGKNLVSIDFFHSIISDES